MKVIVAGGRDFDNYELLSKTLDLFLKNKSDIEIISGTASGADKLGEKYADERGLKIKRFPADWKKYGNSAGFIRNTEMADYVLLDDIRYLIAFWNGSSKGTEHMIKIAKERKIITKVMFY